MRWWISFIVVLAAGVSGASCNHGTELAPNQPVALPADRHGSGGAAGEPRWPFWPRSMRIHPTTRVAVNAETSEPIIDFRVEFRDQYKDVAKAVGIASVDLYDGDAADGSTALNHWQSDLRDLVENDKHYDEITQTYLLRLDLHGVSMPANARLKVRFDSNDGEVFTDAMTLRTTKAE